MAAAPLTLPITFAQPGASSKSIEQQCAEATILCTTAWHANGASGAALGSDDGSIYLLQPAEPTSSIISSSNSPAPASPALLPMPSSDNSPRSSRMLAPFSLTARAPAAVSVTKDQVEAPKNFVDFDAEQEKLAALIQKPASGSVASRRKHVDHDDGPPSTTSSSRAQSPAPPRAISAQMRSLQPLSTPFPPLAPSARIFSPRTGTRHAVTALQTIDDASALIALQECGDLSMYDIRDGVCCSGISLSGISGAPPPASEQPAFDADWSWNRLSVLSLLDSTIVLACASESWTLPSSDPANDSVNNSRCRLAIARKIAHQELVKVSEWIIDAVPNTVNMLVDASGVPMLSFVDAEGKLVTQAISIVSQPLATVTDTAVPAATTVGPITLNIPNPFKHLTSRTEAPHAEKSILPGAVELEERKRAGNVRFEGDILGASTGAVWSNGGVFLFLTTGDSLRSGWIDTGEHPTVDVRWISDSKVVVSSERQSTTYRVNSRSSSVLDFQPTSVLSLPGAHICLSTISSPLILISLRVGNTSARRLVVAPLSSSKSSKAKPVWRASLTDRKGAHNVARVSALLPVDVETILVGYSNGVLARGAYGILEPAVPQEIDGAQIERLFLLRGDTELLVAGDASGAILVWDYPSLKLRQKWVKFLTPLTHVLPLHGEHVGRLNGHVFCIAEDGTAAVLDPSVLELVCVIPGSPAPLERIAIAEDNLLLFYSDGRARLWDVKTFVFWRAMGLDKAEELIGQGEWLDMRLDHILAAPSRILRHACGGGDARTTLLLDVRALNEMTSPPPQSFSFIRRQAGAVGSAHDFDTLPPDADGSQQTTVSPQHVKVVSSVLSSLLCRGLSDDVDEFISSHLDCRIIEPSIGMHGARHSMVLYPLHTAIEAWTISPKYTAARLLATVTLLRICLGFSDWERDASAAIAFYVVTLADYVGLAFQPPCLEYLSHYWYDASAELRQAARTIFESTANRMSDQETVVFVEKWQHELPTLQPDSEKQSARAARALLLAGHVAVEKHTLISMNALTDIAKSISLYLHDPSSPHRVLAIDLCSKGFQIWQHYIDAMEMLRSLFALATNMRKDASTVAPAARLAVLQIASTSTPLFMATLSIDILKPRNLAHRKSTMGLIAFFIRKKPLVLYPNLTRLVEAVVKSLDPNNSTDREAMQDSATEILGQVVKTFPSVDFHMASQRLAMGTTEGAVVLYDLKTATRLYVLDGYTSRVAALSFSPDGRRLAGVSLEECTVNIWKVGQGFTSLFKPGAPPAGSNPFKVYPFNVGDEARMTVASTLDWVSFEWPAERSARLKIRDSTLTFAT